MAQILVVDDHSVNREFLVTLLGYKGHRLLQASDGSEALDVVRAERPDLVICDILMPSMDGFAFVQQLRSDPQIAETKIIFCTAHYLERAAVELASSCGVLHVLTKPVEPQLVLSVVEQVLKEPPARPLGKVPDTVHGEHLKLVTNKLSNTADQLQNINERLAALVDLNLRLASERNPQRLLEQVCLGARQLLGARYAALGVFDRDSGKTTYFVTSGIPAPMAIAFGLPPLNKGILGAVATGGRPYRIAKKMIGASAAGLPEGFVVEHSLLAAPVASPTGVYGWICLTEKLAGSEFTDDDERLLSILAAQTGRTYENGSLYRKVQLHAAEMEIEIGERIRAEQGLRESERRFRDMLGKVKLISVMLDREAKITYCNDFFLELTGWRREEVVGQDWFDLFIDPGESALRAVFNDLIADLSHAWHHENAIVTRSGEGRLIKWNNSVLRSVSGEVIGTASIGEDITERKRAEEALTAEHTLLRTLVDALPDVVFTKDVAGRFTMCNIAGYRHSGFASEAEIIGKSVFDLYPKQYADPFHGDDYKALSGESVLNREEIGIDSTGADRWFLTTKVPLRSSTGTITGLVGISRDISERKKAEQQVRESEAKYRALIEQASDGIYVGDAEGNFVMVNTRGYKLLGYAPGELIGLNGKVTYLDQETEIHTKRLNAAIAGEDLRYERMVKRKDGSAFPADVSLKMLDNGMVQGIIRDITLRRANERKIARLSRIQAVLSGINSAIVRIRNREELFNEACRIAVEHGEFAIGWIAKLDVATGTLKPMAQAGVSMNLTLHARESNGSGLVPIGPAKAALLQKEPAIDNDIEKGLNAMKADPESGTFRVRNEAIGLGAKSVIVLPLFVGDLTFGVLTLYAKEVDFFDDEELKLLKELAGDISFGLEFIAKEEQVDFLAYYDALSGLPNRRLFFDRLAHQLGTASREHRNVVLMLMDLDRFRSVNETLGRQAGDALITQVGRRLKDAFRDEDTVARVGSDSFAIAVTGIWGASEAARTLETHNTKILGQPFQLGQEELLVSATAGVAVFPADGTNPEALFANAEAALRKSKEQNARFLFYSRDMNDRVAESLRLENRLRRALNNGEMVLWYQPKVDARTRKIKGLEALMRWQDPETGMVPPAKFIPLMEQTGLILEAGRWALSQVARDCQSWVNEGVKPPRVAVNVSPIQLRQKDFIATVVAAAQKTEEAGASLDLEITESTIMENVESIVPILQTVRGLGVEIAVDDFGTGYSSLAYIARLPIHDLKIDRSFVIGMAESEDSLAIVRSVISLAHSLRLVVVAEGVETEEQAALLLKLDCDRMQGYLFSRPVPPQEVPRLVRQDTP